MTRSFEIVVAEGDPQLDPLYGTRSGNWTNDIGEANEFATVAEAETGIEQLRQLGDEWATATYAVRAKGEKYPL